ncbi:MAG TPA: amidase [Xanthobacteraceae bacterium]|jgi:amidase|nr:amidase [Xanthobacteraceae bacterium]
MADLSLTHRPARELAKLMRERAVSPVEVLDAHLAAIEAFNPKLNAVVTLVAEQARDAARKAETAVTKGEPLGLLHGLPVAIKDITPTAGIRTTWGSPIYKDHVPTEDAEVVHRLKAAGAIVIGKTNTPEFAAGANTVNPVFGATRNAWNADLSAAGSSGGAGVAVATGMVPIAQGTDFGGSVRVPASFSGIVGLRPTPGLIPSYPMPLAWDFGQTNGPMARDAEDTALMFDAMTGLSRLTPTSIAPPWPSALAEMKKRGDAKGLRVAYVSDIAGIGVEPEIDEICRSAALQLKEAGASVEQIAFDAGDGRAPYMTWRGFWMVGQQYHRLQLMDQFGPNLKGNVEAGLKLAVRDFAAAEEKRQEVFQRFRMLFERFDILLTPTAPVKPFPVEQNYPDAINGKTLDNYIDWISPTFLITLVSLPAASAPAGLTSDHLPVGVQIIAPRFEEPTILRIAKLVHEQSGVGFPPL